jgi:uncharacterized phiE125 gp8 family phage protein
MPALTSRPELTVAPTFEPVTVAELKAHLRLDADNSAFDDTLTAMIKAAREQFERDTDYVCCTSTWRERLDQWPTDYDGEIVLNKRPVASVSSVVYVDNDGANQTWAGANYSLDNGRGLPSIVRAYNVDFPTARSQRNAITLTYVAGVARASVPEQIKLAIKSLAASWFDEPSAVSWSTRTQIQTVPLGYERIVANYTRPSYP